MAEIEVKTDEKITEESKTGEATKEKPSEDEAAKPESEQQVKVDEEAPKPPKVILHQYPRVVNIPSLSLFCLKLETFLRMHKVPYENQYSYKLGKKGKMPWIEYNGEKKCDTSHIIDFLNEKLQLKLDEEFTDNERGIGRAVKVMIEENTYWALSYGRYIENFYEFRLVAAPSGIGHSFSLKMMQRKVESNLEAQGMGRHSKEEIHNIGFKDLKSVSDILGDKQYILGDKPSSIDCTVFSLLAQILLAGLESALSKYVQENAENLVKYCDRMKDAYWSDWQDQIEKSKPEPEKRGFSLRKKHPKAATDEVEPETPKESKTEEKTKNSTTEEKVTTKDIATETVETPAQPKMTI